MGKIKREAKVVPDDLAAIEENDDSALAWMESTPDVDGPAAMRRQAGGFEAAAIKTGGGRVDLIEFGAVVQHVLLEGDDEDQFNYFKEQYEQLKDRFLEWWGEGISIKRLRYELKNREALKELRKEEKQKHRTEQRKKMRAKYPQFFSKQPWAPPSMEKATQKATNAMFKRGTAPLLMPTDEMGTMGPGIALYFQFLVYMGAYFAFATLLVIPNLVLFKNGYGIPKGKADGFGFVYLTAGNLGMDPDRKSVPPEFCQDPNNYDICEERAVQWPGGTTRMDATMVGWLTAGCDLIMSMSLLYFALWWRGYLLKKVDKYDASQLTASDYAVYATGFPQRAKEEKIRQFFNRLYPLRYPHEHYPNYAGCLGRPRYKGEARPFWDMCDAASAEKEHKGRDEAEKKYKKKFGHLRKSVVRDVSHVNGNKKYLDGWVAEVSVVHPIGDRLKELKRMKSLFDEMKESINGLRKYAKNTQRREGPDKEQYDEAMERMCLLDDRFEAFKKRSDRKYKKYVNLRHPMDICTGAFVLFENAESMDRCLSDYRNPHASLPMAVRRKMIPERLQYPTSLQRHPLVVVEASEPEDLVWENLEVVGAKAWVLGATANFLAFVFLMISAATVMYATMEAEALAASTGDTGLCRTDVPASFYGRYDIDTAVNLLDSMDSNVTTMANGEKVTPSAVVYSEELTKQHCGEEQYYLYYPLAAASLYQSFVAPYYSHNSTWVDLLHPEPPAANVSWSAERQLNWTMTHRFLPRAGEEFGSVCDSPCVSTSDVAQCQTLSCYDSLDGWTKEAKGEHFCIEQGYPHALLLACYCSQQLEKAISEKGVYSGISELAGSKVCRSYAKDQLTKQFLTFLVGSIITIINTIAENIMKWITNVERRSSKSGQSGSLSIKIFLLEFINTAIVVLVVNAQLPGGGSMPLLQTFGLLDGDHSDMTRAWYASVGVSICVTMLFNVFVPHLTVMAELGFDAWSRKRRLKQGAESFDSQEELDASAEMYTFEIETRYPVMLNTAFVTLLFSAGMPILLPFAAIAFFICYWVDKYTVLRLAKEPYYDYKLMLSSVRLIPVAAMLHLFISMWTFGNAEIFAANLITGDNYYPSREKKGTVDISGLTNIEKLRFAAQQRSKLSEAEKLVADLSVWDPLGGGHDGFISRAIKGHCFMLLLFICLVIVGVVIASTYQTIWDLFLRRIIAIISFGQWAEFTVDIEHERDEFVSPYTGDYRRELSSSGYLMTKEEKKAGFIQRPIEGGKKRERFCLWTEDGTHKAMEHWDPIQHLKGTNKRSWEGIDKIPSYNIMKNSEYRQVLEFGDSGPRKRGKIETVTKMDKAKEKLKVAAVAIAKVANSRNKRLNDNRQASALMK